ncbi:YtxH domain-containing protein [Aestuariibaculum sp. M13]|uniref:YtxH domain-containing protein n=1 Tax=Aestuariibaculum sp. M13 TaxID=2967132 RepID=UPI002159CC14|nr:YtxH domain-containing protein [Aestuariibaculum sp. M13]MCR8666854.1 YtxH domain-containing protein [Aestuariibaculum sp. M13]
MKVITLIHYIMGKGSGAVLGFLVGTAVGTVLGVLFAPDKGTVTRKKIVDEAQSVKDKMSENIHETAENISNTVKQKQASLEEELEQLMSNASYKADDAISLLEKKLAELKAKNKKYQKS